MKRQVRRFNNFSKSSNTCRELRVIKNFKEFSYFESGSCCCHGEYRFFNKLDTNLENKKIFTEINKPIIKLSLRKD